MDFSVFWTLPESKEAMFNFDRYLRMKRNQVESRDNSLLGPDNNSSRIEPRAVGDKEEIPFDRRSSLNNLVEVSESSGRSSSISSFENEADIQAFRQALLVNEIFRVLLIVSSISCGIALGAVNLEKTISPLLTWMMVDR